MTPEEKAAAKAAAVAKAKAIAAAKQQAKREAEETATSSVAVAVADREDEEKQAAKAAAIAKAKAIAAAKQQAKKEAEAGAKPLSEMTEEEKQAAKAAAVAKAKAITAAKQQAKKEAEAGAKPLSEMTEEEKQAAKAAAVAKAKAAAAARQQPKTEAKPTSEQSSRKTAKDQKGSEKPTLEKKISKKMAFSVLLFTLLVLASSGMLLMKVMNWNGYNSGTEVEKRYRASLEALKKHPDDVEVRYELLATMYTKGLHEEAQTQLQYIAEHAKQDSEIFQKSLYYKGLYHTMNGEDEEAIAAYEQFLAIDPSVGEAWLNLSYAYYGSGQYDAAAAAAGKAGVLLPESADVPYLHGMLLYKDGKNTEALVMFEKALELDRRHQKSTEMLTELRKEGKV